MSVLRKLLLNELISLQVELVATELELAKADTEYRNLIGINYKLNTDSLSYERNLDLLGDMVIPLKQLVARKSALEAAIRYANREIAQEPLQ